MSKICKIFLLLALLVGLGWAGKYLWRSLGGAAPTLLSSPQGIVEPLTKQLAGTATQEKNQTEGLPLKLPPGFTLSVFAKDLQGARVLALDGAGTLLVSLTAEGRVVALPDKDGDGVADKAVTVLAGLEKPHGLAFYGEKRNRLYIAETTHVDAYDYDEKIFTASKPKKIADLPKGDRHYTRSLLFLPAPEGNRLLISVGSSCDVCVEQDRRYAKVLAVNADGGDPKPFASGLRNAMFMALHPRTGQVWATEMGRDLLGDDLPPDELNIIQEGKDYGWPYCYGKRVHDKNFDPAGAKKDFCLGTEPSYIDLPAHSAPLGLAFVPTEGWPQDYQNNLLVAYHGSWNRTVPTGYKIVRVKLDAAGKFLGVEDFITGWLSKEGQAIGRPVDILVAPGGVMYISDDKAGVVYRVAKKIEQ
jgi:glucose/arabinose dehydrogenase